MVITITMPEVLENKVLDRNGLPLQVGSTIAIRKPGKDNFTVRGVVLRFQGNTVIFREERRGFERWANSCDVKRVKYREVIDKRKR